jgi:Tannase and feruloyl esterase
MLMRTHYAAWLASCVLIAAATASHGEAFSDLKQSAVNYAQARLAPRQACAQLADYKGTEILQLAAREVPAADGVPAHCRVSGVIEPEVAFEVNLPAKWNGRFYMIGNGGHAGESFDEPGRVAQRGAALKQGFAFASTNTGHDARREPGGSFGYNNPQKLVDFAYRGVHLTALNSKRIANAYYGEPVSHAYWNACSTGGRQGLMEAQRFWDDFNGIIAGSPVLDFGGKTISGIWNGQAQLQAPITPDKLKVVADSLYAKCDAVDGLADGIIDDPRRCNFDPARDVPQCRGTANDASCITPAQAGTLKKIYGGVVSQGKPYFPGFSPGAEIVARRPTGAPASGWLGALVGIEGKPPFDLSISDGTMKYLVFPIDDPNYDWRRFDFDKDTGQLDGMRALTDATNPDLARFRKRGGKILMYFGWADPLLPPLMGVNYYERAVQANGPDTTDFLRLFMVPGMFHCRGGVGPDEFDAVTSIVNWVEQGRAPQQIVARKFVDGKLQRSRPLCPYPQVARYLGKGSIDEAKNFSCVMPEGL